MGMKLTQSQIDELAKAGALREEDGRRVHKMSPINRAKVEAVIDAIIAPEIVKESSGDELSRAMYLIAETIKDSQVGESQARTLIQDILNTTLKSHGEALCALKDALIKKETPKEWTFDVVRNTAGVMTKIIAKETTT
jgi:polyhydroxyalkanoate synthesis regulator phasin